MSDDVINGGRCENGRSGTTFGGEGYGLGVDVEGRGCEGELEVYVSEGDKFFLDEGESYFVVDELAVLLE